jgi:hypothetical protein
MSVILDYFIISSKYNVIKKKTKQALQIVGHVVAKFYVNIIFLSYLINFRRWKYNCAFYYYYIFDDGKHL